MTAAITVHDLQQSVTTFDVIAELYDRGIYDPIVTQEIDGKLIVHEIQDQALKILNDSDTEELTYGGGAGGAKTWTGCVWLLFLLKRYPRTKAFIARNELTKLKKSTLVTWHKVCAYYGFDEYRYTEKFSRIIFDNGSVIDLIDTAYKPSESYESRFGSLEYTVGWMEEASEQHFDAYDTLKTRIGRHLNDIYDVKPMLLLTCNPAKCWTYSRIYKPFTAGKLGEKRIFLQSLVADNPFIESTYIAQLDKIEDPGKKKRLKFGRWELDEDDDTLVSYDDIISIFDVSSVDAEKRAAVMAAARKTLAADVARQGSDKAVIFALSMFDDVNYVIDYQAFNTNTIPELKKAINEKRQKHNIDRDRAIADEDGVGGGVVDLCRIKGFVNGSKPLKENIGTKGLPRYKNLKTQCAYKLAKRIRDRKLKFLCEIPATVQEQIIEELEYIRTAKQDDDKYYYIMSKEDVKQALGRSPDYSDTLVMSEYFNLKKERKLKVSAA